MWPKDDNNEIVTHVNGAMLVALAFGVDDFDVYGSYTRCSSIDNSGKQSTLVGFVHSLEEP